MNRRAVERWRARAAERLLDNDGEPDHVAQFIFERLRLPDPPARRWLRAYCLYEFAYVMFDILSDGSLTTAELIQRVERWDDCGDTNRELERAALCHLLKRGIVRRHRDARTGRYYLEIPNPESDHVPSPR